MLKMRTALCLALAGCTGGSSAVVDTGSAPTAPPFVVGPNGGTHDFGEATIVVPQGALDEEVELRLIETDAEPPVPYLGLSKVWLAQPEGLTFQEPVQIWLPIDEEAVDDVASGAIAPDFYWSEPLPLVDDDTGDAGPEYARVEPAQLNEEHTQLRTRVSHFSTGFIATLPVFSDVEPRPFPPTDVLFVIDNSCSMDQEQQLVADNLSSFFPVLQDSALEYHVGVISTDMANTAQHAGKLQHADGHTFIDPQTPDPEAIFGEMVQMGTGGDFEEQGRAAAWTMVEEKPDIPRNQGFIREDARLTFVFVSDENDQSGGNPLTRMEFRQWMETKKARPEDVVAHVIVDPPGAPCPGAGVTDGQEYLNYADWTGGEVFDLCEPDWAPFLEDIAHRLFDVARVELDHLPREILEVAVVEDGVETLLSEDDWVYEAAENTVYLEPGVASATLESIRVDYTPE